MSASLEKAIEVEGLTLSIGGELILRGISCSVRRGSVVCVIGQNGAGKSTFLKCVGGLVRRCGGKINILGAPLSSLTQKEMARRVAWVSQSSPDGLFYTVRQFAEMSRFARRSTLAGVSKKDKAAVDAALCATGVESFAARQLSTLSGGERQRAFIASALAQDTEILFFDEPTNFLDYRHQAETLELVGKLKRSFGKTIVLVTHDINLAARAADEILAIKGGRLIWQGASRELFSAELLRLVYGAEFEFLRAGASRAPYVVPRGCL